MHTSVSFTITSASDARNSAPICLGRPQGRGMASLLDRIRDSARSLIPGFAKPAVPAKKKESSPAGGVAKESSEAHPSSVGEGPSTPAFRSLFRPQTPDTSGFSEGQKQK